ncbi:hypothetical protein [Oxalicibacterium faecigallinarum]|uniref:Uncharacterized protein n=1 Tax=Oxalicibacterium faecigallinarum TaxID=573741 RepID=A0A8J3APB6_9BURK|nr:hypothetical protein [Oxalicibacterium faecigallinarum]GGI16410.1 hypothetical protein GCM10008066_03820 [Oxalicibacterium faecigallinarum]
MKVWLIIDLKHALIRGMKKTVATSLLGGTPTAAAEAIGIRPQAYSQWPDVLNRRLTDRVQAAIARQHLSPSLLGIEQPSGEAPDDDHSQTDDAAP